MELAILGFSFTIISSAQVLPILVESGFDLNVFLPLLFLRAPFLSLSTEWSRQRYRIRRHAKSHPREDKEKERETIGRERAITGLAVRFPTFFNHLRFNSAFERNGTRKSLPLVSASMIHFPCPIPKSSRDSRFYIAQGV